MPWLKIYDSEMDVICQHEIKEYLPWSIIHRPISGILAISNAKFDGVPVIDSTMISNEWLRREEEAADEYDDGHL
jgi:hypothetical protein